MNDFHQQTSFQQQQFWESQLDLPGLRQLLAVAVDPNAAAPTVAPATSFQNGLYAQYGLPHPQQQSYVAPNTWPGSIQPMPLGATSMPVYPYHTTPSPPGSSGGTPSPISPSLSMGSSASPYSASPTTPLSAHLPPAVYASSSSSSYGPTTFTAPTPLPASAIPSASSLQHSSSSGPAKGQFAVLTLSGRTLASSGNYKEVLSAARSAKRGAGANGEGIPDETRTCGFCGKVCDRPSTLKTHMNSHTGQRPHQCYVPGCGRQFTVLSNMYRHAKQCAVQHGHVREEAVGARGGGSTKPASKRRQGSARSEDGDEDAEDSS